MIGADYRDDTLFKPHAYKAGYIIGWYMNPGEKENPHSQLIQAFRNYGSKVIVHWVGADIYKLRKFSVERIREFAGALKMATDHILCENELAQEELASYGIEAEIVPIPPYSDFNIEPLPNEFSVALYLTDRSDFDKYLQRHTLSIVKAMPDVRFYGYGDACLEFPEGKFEAANFKHMGSLTRPEWEQFVKDRAAYLRLVRHDTRPLATDEFLMAGRSVITNIPAPWVEYVDTSGDLPFDKWDTFAPGFSAIRWPETKKRIIQAIRKVKALQAQPPRAQGQLSEFDAARRVCHNSLKKLLDKQTFIDRIAEMAKREPVTLGVVA
jgi:hypothetical protein